MMRDLVGQELGKYHLLRLLGRGGFAEVYLGRHVYLKTQAAIKVLHTHMNREQVQGFLQEAQVIAGLMHPNIVRVLDFDVADSGLPFLVMDYCPHGTLRQRHATDGPLPLATVQCYVEQVAAALQHAHDHKLIHRDVKPENMLIGLQNQILLSDFGIVAQAHNTSSMSAQIPIGTIPYMAPEQIQAQARPASDQYSLGIVAYEWLTGERPFSGSYTEIFAKHLMTPPKPLREKVPTLPPLVEEVVLKALAKDPHERFASVRAFAQALRQAIPVIENARHSYKAMAPDATLPVQPVTGGQTPAALATPKEITPPANGGMIGTQPPLVGIAGAGEAQTTLPPLPAYPGQAAAVKQPVERPSIGQTASPQTPPARKHSRRNLLIGLGATAITIGGLVAFGTHLLAPPPSPLVSLRENGLADIAWSPDGKYIAMPSSSHNAIDIWSTLNWRRSATINCPDGLTTISWSPDSKKIIAGFNYNNGTGSNSPNIEMWDIATKKNLAYHATNNASANPATEVSWSPDGNYILVVTETTTTTLYQIQVYNVHNGNSIYQTFSSMDSTGNIAKWSPDSKLIATTILVDSASPYNVLRSTIYSVSIWDAFNRNDVYTYNGHTQKVNDVSWSPDGKRIASCSADKTVQLWDATNGNNVLTYQGHSSEVSSVAWSPDGQHIASCDTNLIVRIWNAADGSDIFTYYFSNSFSSSIYIGAKVMWSPDGKYLAIMDGSLARIYRASW